MEDARDWHELTSLLWFLFSQWSSRGKGPVLCWLRVLIALFFSDCLDEMWRWFGWMSKQNTSFLRASQSCHRGIRCLESRWCCLAVRLLCDTCECLPHCPPGQVPKSIVEARTICLNVWLVDVCRSSAVSGSEQVWRRRCGWIIHARDRHNSAQHDTVQVNLCASTYCFWWEPCSW